MRVLLVAATTGYQTRAFDQAAKNIGYDLVLATDRCHILDDPWGDHAIPVRFDEPLESIEQITGPFDGIAAVGDRPSYVAAVIAQKLGLKFSPPYAVLAAKNKFLAREKFRAAGLLTPVYQILDRPDPPAKYPCVLKPLGLSGSRGVIRANNDREFASAFARVQTISGDPNVLVEDFIPGHEFALEGLVTNGQLQPLALFDKPDPLDGPFFEETIYATVPVDPAIAETTQRAITALGLTHGPVHAEMRVNHQGVWMLEIAARPIGGLCSRVLRFSGETSLEELILRHALGETTANSLENWIQTTANSLENWLQTIDAPLEPGGHAVMMIPIPRSGIYSGVDGIESARSVSGIEDIVITAKPGQEMIPLPEGSSYLGFIFARASTSERAVHALRQSHGQLNFHFAATLPVVKSRPS